MTKRSLWKAGSHVICAALLFLSMCSLACAASVPTIEWVRQRGTKFNDTGTGVALDSTGGVYLGGWTLAGLGGPRTGGEQAFITRYDVSGNRTWTRQYSDSSFLSTDLAIDNTGNFYVSGGPVSAVAVKFDSTGVSQWYQDLNTLEIDEFTDVAVRGSTGIYAVGYTEGSLAAPNGGANRQDVIVSSFDTDGNMLWTRQIGTDAHDIARGVATDLAGNAYVVGSTGWELGGTTLGGRDGFLAKYNSAGALLWINNIGSSGSDIASSVFVDDQGSIYVTGHTEGSWGATNQGQSDLFVSKFDSNGGQVWTEQFGSSLREEGHDIWVDSGGNVYVSGFTKGDLFGTLNGFDDAIVLGLDSEGNQLWSMQFGTEGQEIADHLVGDNQGHLYLSGTTSGALDYYNLGENDAFIAKITLPTEAPTTVPEPSSLLLLALGLVLFAAARLSLVVELRVCPGVHGTVLCRQGFKAGAMFLMIAFSWQTAASSAWAETYEDPLEISGGHVLDNPNGPHIEFAAGITGTNSLVASRFVGTLRGDVDFVGDFYTTRFDTYIWMEANVTIPGEIRSGGGQFSFAGDGSSFANLVAADGTTNSSLYVDSNFTIGSLVMDPRGAFAQTRVPLYDLRVAPDRLLTISGEFDYFGGTLSGPIGGQSELVKQRGVDAWLLNTGGSQFETVTIEGNVLTATGWLGDTPTDFHLAAGSYSELYLEDVGIYSGDIHLNNHSAVDALTAENTTLAGGIYLGNQGSVITRGEVTGQIHGGTLYKSGIFDLALRSADHTFTGETRVSDTGDLVLIDGGVLPTTSAIVLESRGELVIDNRGSTALADRVPDTTPVIVETGGLVMYGRAGATVTETLDFTAAGGFATIRVESDSAAGSQTRLTLDPFQRQVGSAVSFEEVGTGSAIYFGAAPTLNDGMIGGWAAYGKNDFATYGPTGVAAHGSSYVQATDLNVNVPTDVVSLNGVQPVLGANRTINGLIIRTARIDLAGNTLTLDSGGVLVHGSGVNWINNGSLTSAGSELFFLSPEGRGIEIGANIVDGPGGPVSVVVSGASGQVDFNSANTYSGDTTVNLSRLYLEAEGSLPAGTNIHLNGGDLVFNYATPTDELGKAIPVQVGEINITNGGRLVSLIAGTDAAVEATALHVESGYSDVELVGDAPLTKTSNGTFTLDQASPRWSGPIDLQAGTLRVSYPDALGNAPLNAAHAVKVPTGAILELEAGNLEGRLVILDGGKLEGNFGGPIRVRSDSTIGGDFNEYQGDFTGSGDLTILGGHFSVFENALTISGSLNEYSGNIFVDGGYVRFENASPEYDGQVTVTGRELSFGHSDALGSAEITVQRNGILRVPAFLANDVRLEGGALRFGDFFNALNGSLTVHDDSYVYIHDLPSVNEYRAPGFALFNGNITLTDQSSLKFMGDSAEGDSAIFLNRQVYIDGDLILEGAGSLISYDQQVNFNGRISQTSTDATLDLRGNVAFLFGGTVDLPQNSNFTILRDGVAAQIPLNGQFAGLSGGGTLHNDVIVNAAGGGGTISPGASEGTTGLLTVDGAVQILANSRMVVDLNGTTVGSEYDRLHVTGDVELAGTLELTAHETYTPTAGDTFQVITAASLSGQFEEVTGVDFDDNFGLALIYNSNDVTIRTTLLGDVDFDDDIDTADITVMFQNFTGAAGTGQMWGTGDVDGDGDVDTADLTAAFQRFTGAGGSAFTAETVPEPSGWLLLVLGMLGFGSMGLHRQF